MGWAKKIIADGTLGTPAVLFRPDRFVWWSQFLTRRWAGIFNLIREYPEVFAQGRNGAAHGHYLIHDIAFKRELPEACPLEACQVTNVRHLAGIDFDLFIKTDITPLKLLMWMSTRMRHPQNLDEKLLDLIGDYPLPVHDDPDDAERIEWGEFESMESPETIAAAVSLIKGRPEFMVTEYSLPRQPTASH